MGPKSPLSTPVPERAVTVEWDAEMTAKGSTVPKSASKPGGLRERKRNELYDRIVRVGYKLFLKHGYETTTIDMIAEDAKISRRTFFHYFPTKEDVLFTIKGEFEWMKEAAARCTDNVPPLTAVEHILEEIAKKFSTHEFKAVDKIVRPTPYLMARRHVHYERWENALAAAMVHRWPGRDYVALRIAAISGVAILRVSSDLWSLERYHRPLHTYLASGFSGLRRAVGNGS
jgi:AcrR family transcriptional regulator